MDEVEIDKLLKEASEAIDDADKLAAFIREKAASAVERFLVSHLLKFYLDLKFLLIDLSPLLLEGLPAKAIDPRRAT